MVLTKHNFQGEKEAHGWETPLPPARSTYFQSSNSQCDPPKWVALESFPPDQHRSDRRACSARCAVWSCALAAAQVFSICAKAVSAPPPLQTAKASLAASGAQSDGDWRHSGTPEHSRCVRTVIPRSMFKSL